MARVLAFACGLLAAMNVSAHHSVRGIYDFNDVREIEGKIIEVKWVNPHIRINIETPAGEVWSLDASSTNTLQRNGISSDLFNAGDQLSGIGPVARNGSTSMVAANVRFADGQLLTLFAIIADQLDLEVNTSILPPSEELARADDSSGLFRVWFPRSRPQTGANEYEWPLTEAAVRAKAEYDPLVDDLALECISAGMPVILDTPYPIQFSEEGDDIVMRFEEWDGVRTIYMSGNAIESPSPMGVSMGRWEGDTLVIHTKNVNYPYFDDVGTPQSEQSEIVERFTLSEDDQHLDWEAIITDPQVFTEPVVFRGDMEWVPGEQLKPFNCTLVE